MNTSCNSFNQIATYYNVLELFPLQGELEWSINEFSVEPESVLTFLDS